MAGTLLFDLEPVSSPRLEAAYYSLVRWGRKRLSLTLACYYFLHDISSSSIAVNFFASRGSSCLVGFPVVRSWPRTINPLAFEHFISLSDGRITWPDSVIPEEAPAWAGLCLVGSAYSSRQIGPPSNLGGKMQGLTAYSPQFQEICSLSST